MPMLFRGISIKVAMNSNMMLSLVIISLILVPTIGTASATLDYYFLDISNVQPTDTRNHTFTYTFNGTLNVTIPSAFTVVSYSGLPNITASSVQWYSAAPVTVNLVLQQNGSCIEGAVYKQYIYLDSVLQDNLKLLCIKDSDLVNLKFEDGHGDSAWLDEPYFSYPFTVHTLIRVFEHGNYFDNEVGKNASISCSVPADMFVSGKFSSVCDSSICNITKSWEELDTSLFRVFSFMQSTNYSVGQRYYVNCTDIVWNFTHEGIRATLGNNYLESRSAEPFTFTKSNTDRILNYTITNSELYTAYDLVLTFFREGETIVKELPQLDSGESESFLISIDDDDTVTLDVDFTPSWQYNSRSPVRYQQNDTYVYSLKPASSSGAGFGGGVVCSPKTVQITTATTSYVIKCQNLDRLNYRMNVSFTGDLANISRYVQESQYYSFLLERYSTKNINIQFDYRLLNKANYSGSVIIDSADVSTKGKTTFYITAVTAPQNLTRAQQLFGSLALFDIPTAFVIASDAMLTPAIVLKNGSAIPLLLFVFLFVLLYSYIFIRLKRRYDISDWIYIIYALLLIVALFAFIVSV